MAKGIDAVISVVLILMITIALTAMAYIWFTDVFESTSSSVSESTEQTVNSMITTFSIENMKNSTASSSVNVTLRNSGQQAINSSSFKVYFDDAAANLVAGQSLPITYLSAGQVLTVNISVASDPCANTAITHKVRVTTSGGTAKTAKLVC